LTYINFKELEEWFSKPLGDKIKIAAAIFYKQHGIDCVFTGLSAFESRTRKIFIAHNGLMYRAKRLGSYKLKQPILKANPVGYWTDKDIWGYIELNGLPINPIYNFTDRNGCMTCTGFIGWDKQLSRINPKLYRKIMHMIGKTVLSDFGGDSP